MFTNIEGEAGLPASRFTSIRSSPDRHHGARLSLVRVCYRERTGCWVRNAIILRYCSRSSSLPSRLPLCPLPVTDLRHVIAMHANVFLMLNQFVASCLLGIRREGAQLRHSVDHIRYQVEAIE